MPALRMSRTHLIGFSAVCFLILTPAWVAEVFPIKRGADIVLTSADCESLLKQAQALSAWKARIEPNLRLPPLPLHCAKSERGFELTVTPFTPAWVVEHNDEHPAYDGPNCWATSSYLQHMTPSLFRSVAGEFTFYLKSRRCQQKSYEERKPGDIVVVRSREAEDPGFAEVHGFIYLTDEMSFSKNGRFNGSTFSLQSLDGVFGTYGVSAECALHPEAPDCGSYALIFRCDASPAAPANLTAEEVVRYQWFLGALADLSDYVVSGRHTPESVARIGALFDTLGAVETYAKAHAQAAAGRHEDGAVDFWQQIYWQVQSVRGQQEMIEFPPRD